jgi:subtilisin family serine protease
MQLAATPGAAPALERWAWLRVGAGDLSGVRAMAPGETRRSAAIERMRAVTDAGVGPASDALRGALRAAGVEASVDVVERLWLDGSAVVRVRAGADASGIDEALEHAGARVLDPADLPGGAQEMEPMRAVGARAASTPEPDGERQWFADEAGFTAAHAAGLTGEGVRVAVVDSGVDAQHPDLSASLARGAVLDPFADTPVQSGHGTFVAGIVAGARTGLAPGVDLFSSRTYGASFGDHRGEDQPSRIAQRVNAVRALQSALAPADGRRGADILGTSWGILDAPGEPAHDYDAARATIAAAGAVVVAAAGNDGGADGRATIAVPAQLEDVIAVGGVTRELRWHPSASRGPSPRTGLPKPDLAAPVVDMRSLAPGGGLVDTSGNPDGGFAGTSAAAPVAASLIAVLTQAIHDRGGASPDLDEVRSVLPMLTMDVDQPGIDPQTGHGVVDATRVVEAAEHILARR